MTNTQSSPFISKLQKIIQVQTQNQGPSNIDAFNQFSLDYLFQNVNFQKQAKDPNGNLHPQYKQPLTKGFDSVRDYIQLYTNDILNTIREIDFLCAKTAYRKMQNYQKCKEEYNIKVHKQIMIPLVNASTFLYKVSNQCLLKGNNVDICSTLISDHTHFMFKYASEKIRSFTEPLQQLVPEDVEPAKIRFNTLNNKIED